MAQQIDLFMDSMVGQRWREDRALMEFPFFSLQKQRQMEPIVYNDGRVTIEVSPGKRGIATIWDKDILIYITSLINDRLERGLATSPRVTFSARDCLRTIGRADGGANYEDFKDALFRLRSTTITTSIQSAGEEEERGFGWIEGWKIVNRASAAGGKRMEAVEVTIADWMYRAIVKERRVLSIEPAYFKLAMGLERRIYELVRKHLGQQPSWVISLPRLAEKIGSVREHKKLKAELSKIVRRDSLPSYTMALEVPAGLARPPADRVMVAFGQRSPQAVDM